MLAIELTDAVKSKIIEAHKFWFTKRVLFNILIGVAGIIGLASIWNILFREIYDLVFIATGSIVWGLLANGMYSLGFEIDSFIIHKTKGLKSLGNNRVILYWVGTSLYIIVSMLFPFSMIITIPD